MPDYAYYDYLEERGWQIEELRECEEWCYPFGDWVLHVMYDFNGLYYRNRCSGTSATGYLETGALSTCIYAFRPSCVAHAIGDGTDWWLYQ